MEPKFWHERWEQNRIGFHQSTVNRFLTRHWAALNLPEEATVLVPMCGKSLDMIWLREQGHRVLGVELSSIAARDFFKENGLSATRTSQGAFERWQADGISLLCGNFFDLTAADLNGATGVYDRAALIALPPEMRRRYAEHLCKVLPEGARSLAITIDYPQEERGGPPFSVPEAEVRALFGDAFEVTQVASEDVHAENPRFQDASRLAEHVYVMRKGAGDSQK